MFMDKTQIPLNFRFIDDIRIQGSIITDSYVFSTFTYNFNSVQHGLVKLQAKMFCLNLVQISLPTYLIMK
jgi:hypothetical protein